MAMREECKHFQSRTYASGDTARFCSLDLAPEAPWRCPADCKRYERRLADAAFQRGTLVAPATPEEPPTETDVGSLLDSAEDIINLAGPSIVADVKAEREKARKAAEAPPKWQLWKRFKR
jgi:hypothetical protein